MGAMTPAGALLASGVIGGGSSLLSGLLSSDSAAANNRAAMNFQKWSQLQAQQYQTQMYNQQKLDQENFYKKYQSPQAIAQQLSLLGVNPAVALSGGHGVGAAPAAMPSGISSPALSAPSLENEGTVFAQSIQALGSAMSSLAQSGATNEQSQESLATFNERLNALFLQNNQTKLMNAKAEWDLYCSQQKLPYEIQEMALKAYSDYYSCEYSKALAKLTDIQAYIDDHSKEFTIEQRNQLSLLAGKQVLLASEDIKLRQEQQETERTQQRLNRSGVTANYASARNSDSQAALNHALTKTEDALRTHKVTFQRATAYVAQASTLSEINKRANEATKEKWFSELIHNQNVQLVLENMDRSAYNAMWRIINGRKKDGDANLVLNALENYVKVESK